MKIAITGTRGIPNRYGGFEQFAEYLSAKLARRGHEVWVYNSDSHPFRQNFYGNVRIIRKWLPEKWVGPGAHYLYDYFCLKNAIRQNADVILECGYASAAPLYPILNLGPTRLITHMDGMEWQRKKWNSFVRRNIRKAEDWAVRLSHAIVCDHPLIADYYKNNYNGNPEYIPYGVDIPENTDKRVLNLYKLDPYGYWITVARLEPENHIRMILEGHRDAAMDQPLIVIGDYHTAYGRKLHRAFARNPGIIFHGAIYDLNLLNSLRHFSRGLFHGHSVGGTNPSLLEAMSSGANIIAHDNPYNRYVLGKNAFFFNSREDVRKIILKPPDKEVISRNKNGNLDKIRTGYRWEMVIDRYEELFLRLTH